MLIWIDKTGKRHKWNYKRFWRNILPYIMILLFFLILGIVGKWDTADFIR